MKINWYLQIRNLSKTDKKALELYNNLQNAESDDDKENAKITAQEYLQTLQSQQDTNTTPDIDPETENQTVDNQDGGQDCDETVDLGNAEDRPSDDEDSAESTQETQKKDPSLTDLSQPAFNPRLARYGITREEELFLHGVFVRKMNREEKLLMRRSIYQKKSVASAKIQAEYKQKRIAQKMKDANDPEKIKFHQERRFVSAIVDALNGHKNLGWIFSEIEGLTPDVFRDLIKKPGNINAFNLANPNFISNFRKKFGE